MTKKGLLKIIREVVRSEVKKEVQKIFMNENKTVREPQVQSKPKKQYTQNKSLNDVLNETVGLKTSEKQDDEYPTLGGGTFDSSKMAELMGYGKSEEVKSKSFIGAPVQIHILGAHNYIDIFPSEFIPSSNSSI